MKRLMKKIILKLLPDSQRLRFLAYRPMLKTWKKNLIGENYPVFNNRYEMYDYINVEIIKDKKLQYLEFGVYEGESIKYFANINSNPASRFIGFDTFTGLPEDWIGLGRTVKRKEFNVEERIPQCDDDRVSFIKGMFQETLPDFMETYEPSEQLVINNDSDLYSSTLYVLTFANQIIRPGTIIIFDEFYSVMHEFRALKDYCSAYVRNYKVVAATNNYIQVAIKIL